MKQSENIFQCCHCEGYFSNENVNEFDGENYCENCFSEIAVTCQSCYEVIHCDENCGNSEVNLCGSCRDTYYSTCSNCGVLVRNGDTYYLDDDEYDDDDGEALCYECYQRVKNGSTIHSYNYKPEPIFYGGDGSLGERFLGVELEIDYGGKDNDKARTLINLANYSGEYAYIKSDGSLEDGMEIVTHPMALNFHQDKMPWMNIMKKAVELDYLSHKADTCGLHIHVNRDSLGKTESEQEATISRVLFLVELFWNPLLKFSRRTQYQLSKWAARYGVHKNPKDVMDTAKKGCHNRYTCVNLTNSSTIEFRIFRGTLKYNTLIATLQLVDELCNVAFSISDEAVTELSWSAFVEALNAQKHSELILYLKERRLYINEPIIEYEEDF